jgi:hypothetical protein
MVRTQTAWAGFGYLFFVLLTLAAEATRPAPNVSTHELAHYVGTHQGSLAMAILTGSAALLCFGVVLHGLGSLTDRGGLMLIGGIGFAALAMVCQAVLGAAIQRPWPEDTTAALAAVSGSMNPMESLFIAVFLVGALRSLPAPLRFRWLAWASVAFSVLTVPTVVTDDLPPLALSGFIGFALMAFWIVAVSVALLRSPAAPADPATPAAATAPPLPAEAAGVPA